MKQIIRPAFKNRRRELIDLTTRLSKLTADLNRLVLMNDHIGYVNIPDPLVNEMANLARDMQNDLTSWRKAS